MVTIQDILTLLRKKRFALESEKMCQKQIFLALSNLKFVYLKPEEILDPKNIIDFLIDGIGIEVKLRAQKRALYNQCVRYCEFDQIKTFLLITNQTIGLPTQINGKDCYVLNIGKAWL